MATALFAVLPAASRHEPVSEAGDASGPAYAGAEHEASPESASPPPSSSLTGLLYQPFTSGARSGAAFTSGGVESYLKPKPAAVTWPATSVQVPPIAAALASGPAYAPLLQPAMPETESDPEKLADSGALYQPFESGPRL